MTAPYAPESMPDAVELRKSVEIETEYPDIDDDIPNYEEIQELITGALPQSLGISF